MQKIMNIYKEFTSLEGSLFVYSLSFSLLLALAPSLLLFAMLFRYAYLPIDMILNFVINFLPDTNVETLDQIFNFFTDQNYSIITFVVTICVSFYLASRSIYSFMLISASHEEVSYPKWTIRVKSIFLFIVLTIGVAMGVFLITSLHDFLPLLSALVMLTLFTLLYRFLSFRKRTLSFGVIGAMFSTIFVMGLAALFVNIVNKFTSYKDIYGPLASLVTLLLAIYLISCIIYLGYCLNIVFEEDYDNQVSLPLKNETYYHLCMRIQRRVMATFRKQQS